MVTFLKSVQHEGRSFYYRHNTSDSRVFDEVVVKKCYRRVSWNFDVGQSERWLDLGANVGAFAFYCLLNGASADCYEPDEQCFKLLNKNAVGCTLVNSAVTSSHSNNLVFNQANRKGVYSRGTTSSVRGFHCVGQVRNTFAGDILDHYDGVKVDIEGSEFGILDEQLLPYCDKLVMEYHTSRDDSPSRLKRRVGYLREVFEQVRCTNDLTEFMDGKRAKPFLDRLIFCWGRR